MTEDPFSTQEGIWEEDSKKESSDSSLPLGHGPLTPSPFPGTLPILLPSGTSVAVSFPELQ